MPLTDLRIRALKPLEKRYRVSDGESLYLQVQPTGMKAWRFHYRFGGTFKSLSIGTYPEISLAEARQLRDSARQVLGSGLDPSTVKREEKVASKIVAPEPEPEPVVIDMTKPPAGSFEQVAREWFRIHSTKLKPAYAQRVLARLEGDVFPVIGRTPIGDVKPMQYLDAARQIEARGAIAMARRVTQSVSQIFRYAIFTGLATTDPTTGIAVALKPVPKAKRRASLDTFDLPTFLRKLDTFDDGRGSEVTRLALNFVILTWGRTGEIRFAQWSEIEGLDGPEPQWRIPAERMKMGREHIVPLVPQAVEILRYALDLAGDSEFIFPGNSGARGVMSENTMIFALYRMGYHSRATVHGFRHLASTLANERDWNSDWIEMQLAHSKSDVRSVYNAAKYLAGRRTMLTWWADLLDEKRALVAKPVAVADAAPAPKPRRGRPPIGEGRMSNTERGQRARELAKQRAAQG